MDVPWLHYAKKKILIAFIPSYYHITDLFIVYTLIWYLGIFNMMDVENLVITEEMKELLCQCFRLFFSFFWNAPLTKKLCQDYSYYHSTLYSDNGLIINKNGWNFLTFTGLEKLIMIREGFLCRIIDSSFNGEFSENKMLVL